MAGPRLPHGFSFHSFGRRAAAYNQTEGSSVPLDPQTFNAAWATELAQALWSRNKAVLRNKSCVPARRPRKEQPAE
jgi:hypothetical protein